MDAPLQVPHAGLVVAVHPLKQRVVPAGSVAKSLEVDIEVTISVTIMVMVVVLLLVLCLTCTNMQMPMKRPRPKPMTLNLSSIPRDARCNFPRHFYKVTMLFGFRVH